MLGNFDEDVQVILSKAKDEMCSLNHPYVGSEHLFLSILSFTDLDIVKVLNSYGITYSLFKDELIKVVDWHFSQYKTDMWRYATSEMDGTHTTAVIAKNELFEFCINKLGWSYRIDDMWYY